ncbi:MAG: potassium-transporting ATPase potassium-binding subunit [Solirubrobacteraceae bacterium]|jgi:K+-transporting ATPase ATPase A chain|nr:potassium-transporting ATPase potassium-binding subunit [Solirubrobacteraceae bacterium]
MLQGWLQIALFFALVVALTPLIGGYMARLYTGEHVLLTPVLGPVERLLHRSLRVEAGEEQDWKRYARSVLVFSGLSWLVLYLILRTQTLHPFNPQGFHSPTWDVTFNTVSSFVTNTNWQFYGGETTMTYFSQMAGLTVQNFVSAAVGICVAIAVIRGLTNRGGRSLGNFWQDLIRTLLYVLLPISLLGALVLVSQGAIQNFSAYATAHTLAGGTQTIALGPVASQEIIKELGTNGGGFFNTNSAMPFENPSGLSNFVEMVAILLIPAGLTATYGRMVGSRRQGWAIFAAMSILFLAGVVVAYVAEQHGTPAQHLAGVSTNHFSGSTGGNLEGKEQRFGIAGSALWTAVTTVTSTGAVNAGLESLTGLGGAVPFANLSMSEVVFGGAGTGLYSMLVFVLIAVFIGGLMVGRTPEYLGKKVGAREIKLLTLGALFTPLAALMTSATAIAAPAGKQSIAASGPQGFTEGLYAYLSQANNNGSAWAGYTGYVQPHPGNLGAHGVTFADLLGGLTMVFARFAPIVIVLAVAGALASKRVAPAGLGTMRTDTPTFVALLIGVIVLVGALTFFPAILLGPIVQGLTTNLF